VDGVPDNMDLPLMKLGITNGNQEPPRGNRQ